MKCEFCGGILDPNQDKCKYCGAPCPSEHLAQIELKRQNTTLKSSGMEKQEAVEQNQHSDELRPMSSPDISFLKENQEETENGNSFGCIIITIIVIIAIIVIAVMASK